MIFIGYTLGSLKLSILGKALVQGGPRIDRYKWGEIELTPISIYRFITRVTHFPSETHLCK